jgi:hypothetical protein
VAKGFVKQFFITRLPVGHTHEDIDAKFAKIWDRIKRAHVTTVSSYERNIKKALQPTSDSTPCNVIDLFAIPDYQSYFTPHIDKKFAKYSK